MTQLKYTLTMALCTCLIACKRIHFLSLNITIHRYIHNDRQFFFSFAEYYRLFLLLYMLDVIVTAENGWYSLIVFLLRKQNGCKVFSFLITAEWLGHYYWDINYLYSEYMKNTLQNKNRFIERKNKGNFFFGFIINYTKWSLSLAV